MAYHFSCKRSLHPRSYVNRRHPKWDPLAFAASVWEVCLAAAHVKVNVTSLPCHGLSWFLHESSTELPLVGNVLVSKPSYTARVICSTSQVVQVSITCGEGHMIRQPWNSALGSLEGKPFKHLRTLTKSILIVALSIPCSKIRWTIGIMGKSYMKFRIQWACALTSKHLRNPCFLSSMWVNCTSK